MPQTPLDQMADTGYENMSEESGYILSEMKPLFRALERAIDGKISKGELSALWRTVESQYALRSDFLALTKTVEHHLNTGHPIPEETLQMLNVLLNANDLFGIRRNDIEISSAEVLTLNATPKELVPAPVDGSYVDIVHMELFLDYNSAAYVVDPGEDLSIAYATAGEILKFTSVGFLDQASSQRRAGAPNSENVPVGVNEAVLLQLLVGEVLTGNSPLKVRVDYRLIKAIS